MPVISQHSSKLLRKKKNLFIKLYKQNFGVIQKVCNIMKMSRSTYYLWYWNDQSFKKRIEQCDIQNVKLDIAEQGLMFWVQKKHVDCIKFFLDRKGKSRGYGKTVKVQGQTDIEIKWVDDEEQKSNN